MTNTPYPSISGYTILDIAGQGGMGIVYRAEHNTSKRQVALKMLTTAQKEEAVAKFQREALLSASLEHPHILPIYDIGQIEEQPYMVMRFVEGGSVSEQLQEHGVIATETAVIWLSDIADALDLAHEQGLVHKDIKPSNMLLDTSGNVYLTDFGIAGMSDTENGRFAGSAAYMAPEQGKGENTDGRADIYALSVTLFELLTGEKPYWAETALGVVVSHINEPIPNPRARQADLPLAFADLIMWGMSKDAADRPQTAAEFAQLLQQAQQAPDVPFRSDSPALQLPPPAATTTDTEESQPAISTQLTPEPSGIGRWLIAGVILLAIIGLAFFLAPFGLTNNESVETAGPISEPTIVIVPTVVPSPTPEGQLFFDDFEGASSSTDQDDAVAILDGTLVFNTKASSRYATYPTSELTAQDINATVDLLDSPRASAYELLVSCRWQDEANYTAFLLRVTPNGNQLFLIKLVAGATEVLSTADLNSNDLSGAHKLNAICKGATLQFIIDSTAVLTGEDPSPTQGNFALMTRPLQDGPPHTVIFDHLEIRDTN